MGFWTPRDQERGALHLPQMASWLEGFVHKLACFPTGKHDDMVDAASQALLWWLWARDAASAREQVPQRPATREELIAAMLDEEPKPQRWALVIDEGRP